MNRRPPPADSVVPSVPVVTCSDGKTWVDLSPWGGPTRAQVRSDVPPDVAASASLAAYLARADRPEGRTVAEAIDLYLRLHRWRTPGGKDWGLQYLRSLRREVGGYRCDEISRKMLRCYVAALRRKGLSAKTANERQSRLLAVLRMAHAEGWLSEPVPARVPTVEDFEPQVPAPDHAIIREDEFRALRARLYETPYGLSALRRLVGPAGVDRAVAERRAFVSWAYYTGAHKADCERTVGAWVDLAAGVYQRHNQKSARVIAPAACVMPEQLRVDLGELARVTGPWQPDQVILGGPWPSAQGPIQRAARDAGIATPVNLRSVFRRSCAWQYMIRGWRREDVAEILGHVDRRMVERIYSRLDSFRRYPQRVPWDRAHPEPRAANVIQFPGKSLGAV